MSISANQRGILAICGSMVAYTVNDAMVKEIARSHPVGEVIFIRGLFTTLLIGSIVVALGYAGELRRALSRPVILRSLCDGLSTACFVVALVHMKLADLAAVLQVAPLILAAFSVLFYRETVGWRRWTAIIVGFIGALVRRQADAVSIRRLGNGCVAGGDVLGVAGDADPADRP